MALFYECIQWCAHIVLDTADIVRDGDFSPTDYSRGVACAKLRVRAVRNFPQR